MAAVPLLIEGFRSCYVTQTNWQLLKTRLMYKRWPYYVRNLSAQIFVRGLYVFREIYSFPNAKLDENCEPRYHMIMRAYFRAKWRLLNCRWIILQRAGKKKQEFFSVLKYDLMNRHICSSSATTRKHFSSLELNSKRRFIVLDARFEKWEISPGIYLWTFLSFSRGMFG